MVKGSKSYIGTQTPYGYVRVKIAEETMKAAGFRHGDEVEIAAERGVIIIKKADDSHAKADVPKNP